MAMEVEGGFAEVGAYQVPALLEAKGLPWDRVLVGTIARRNWHSGVVTREEDGLMHYFMDGDRDVAYYSLMFGNLHIHPKPREWGQEILASHVDITHRYRRT